MNYIIDDSALIEEGVKIEDFVIIKSSPDNRTIIRSGSVVGHHTILYPGSVIGEGAQIGPFNEIRDNCVIEKNVIIQGRSRLGNRVFVGEGSVIKYGAIITSNTYISNNCFIGPNSIVTGSDESRSEKGFGMKNSAIIGKNVFIGAGTVMNASCKIADNVFVGANSYVIKDITDSGTYAGTPIRKIKKDLPDFYAKTLDVPNIIDGVGVMSLSDDDSDER